MALKIRFAAAAKLSTPSPAFGPGLDVSLDAYICSLSLLLRWLDPAVRSRRGFAPPKAQKQNCQLSQALVVRVCVLIRDERKKKLDRKFHRQASRESETAILASNAASEVGRSQVVPLPPNCWPSHEMQANNKNQKDARCKAAITSLPPTKWFHIMMGIWRKECWIQNI